MKEVINVVDDPYGRKYYASKKRRSFNALKQTKEFKLWKQRQYKIQQNKCAYCKVSLNSKNVVTHIDHIQPLYYEGSNDFSNLLLSCRRCNLKKWISNKYVVPEWIKVRSLRIAENERLNSIRREQTILMHQLIQQEIDEQMLYGDNEWLNTI